MRKIRFWLAKNRGRLSSGQPFPPNHSRVLPTLKVSPPPPVIVQAIVQEESSRIRVVRDLVMSHGWNSTCYQIINPGIEHWFAAAGDAVVGYVKAAGFRVVAGAPVCPLD